MDLDLVAFRQKAQIQCAQIAGIAYSEKPHGKTENALAAHRVLIRASCSLARAHRDVEFASVTLKTTRAVPKPHKCALRDSAGAMMVFRYQRSHDLTNPRSRVLHI